LHGPAGKNLVAESTTLAAGDTIIVQNNGDTVIHVFGTLGGTGTVHALNAANNLAITINTGPNLFGPYDPSVFGSSFTITTATATGSVALYHIPARKPNPLCNPFETNSAAPDSP